MTQQITIPAPIRTLLYQCPKRIPNMIPMEEIEPLANAFDKVSKVTSFGKEWDVGMFLAKRNKVLFWTSFYLALRPKEAVCLQFSDIWQTTEGKYFVKIRGDNNKRRKDRILPVPTELVNILAEFMQDFEYRKFWNNSPWLFPQYHDRQKPLSRYQWNDLFQKVIKYRGLWKKHPTRNRGLYVAYSLRHTRAVDLLEKSNFDLWLVANVLGHGRIDVCAAYLPLCPTIQNHLYDVMNR